jgi:hypothetical protein
MLGVTRAAPNSFQQAGLRASLSAGRHRGDHEQDRHSNDSIGVHIVLQHAAPRLILGTLGARGKKKRPATVCLLALLVLTYWSEACSSPPARSGDSVPISGRASHQAARISRQSPSWRILDPS